VITPLATFQTSYFNPWGALPSQQEKIQMTTQLTSMKATIDAGCTGAAACQECYSGVTSLNTQFTQLIQDYQCTGVGCTEASTAAPAAEVTSSTSGVTVYNKVFEYFVQKAYAADTRQGESSSSIFQYVSSGIGLAGVLVVFIALLATWSDTLDRWWARPLVRGIMYTVHAALVGGLLGFLHGVQMPAIEGNIEKIDKILALAGVNFSRATSKEVKTISFNGIELPEGAFAEEVPLTTPNGQSPPCAFGGDGKGGCMQAGNNQQIRLSNQGLSALSAGVEASNRLEQGLSQRDKLTAATMGNASDLARMNGAIKKKLRETEALLNKKLQEKKIAPINFNDARLKMLNQMYKVSKQVLNNEKGQALMATVGKGMPEGSLSAEDKKALSKEAIAGLKSSASDQQAAGDGMSQFEMTALDSDPAATGLTAGLEPEQVDVSMKSVKDEGIFNNPDASIFEQVSVRYLKSAYPVLFNEVK
jgi:hypothetical protein